MIKEATCYKVEIHFSYTNPCGNDKVCSIVCYNIVSLSNDNALNVAIEINNKEYGNQTNYKITRTRIIGKTHIYTNTSLC